MNKSSIKSIIWIIIGILALLLLVKVFVALVPVILAIMIVIWIANKFKSKKMDSQNNDYRRRGDFYKSEEKEDYSNDYIDVDYEDIDK